MGRKKKTPYNECVWEWITTESERFCITTASYSDRSKYFLWRKKSDDPEEWEKIGDAKTPLILCDKYI